MKKEKMKKEKMKLISSLVVFCLFAPIFATLIPCVMSEPGTTVSIGSAEVNVGDSVVVQIMINDVDDVVAANIILNYNEDVVYVTDIGDTAFGMETHKKIDNTSGQVEYAVLQSIGSLNGNVRLANVTLEAVGEAGKSCDLNLTVVSLQNSTYEEIQRDVLDGTFTITNGPTPPSLVTYTISTKTITPPQTTEIDVKFSERVKAWITIEDSSRNIVNELYYSPGVTNPDPQFWNGTNTTGIQVPDGDYYVNVTGLNTTTNLSVIDNTEIITVQPAAGPTTTANATELSEEPSPIPSGYELNWTTEDVVISFRRIDNGGSDVDYTNVSTNLSESWTKVNATAAVGPNAGIISAITEETFNVTVSDEGTTTIWYYSVDTPNTEDTKNLTVRIDKTAPGDITDLNATATGPSWIQWNWTNPTAGFDHVEVWLDAEQKQDVTGESYKAEGLTPDTLYNISVRAVDGAGNKGNWANDTAQTQTVIPLPFVIDGYVSYANDTACNNASVNITNIDTTNNWTAQTSASTNYYKLNITSWTDVNVSERLQIDATSPDGLETNTTTHTVTQDNVSNGGLLVNITLSPAVGKPDLIVASIDNNPSCTNVVEELFVNESNNISAVVNNVGTGDVTEPFDVCFKANDTLIGTENVTGGLLAGANTTVYIDWTPSCGDYIPTSVAVTVNVTADCNNAIEEGNESNNTLLNDTFIYNNGYKSKNFDCNTTEEPLTLFESVEMYGGVEYNVSGTKIYPFKPAENDTRVHHIDIPTGMTVKMARLYVYWYDYYYNPSPGYLANLSVNFSGTLVPLDAAYTDQKGFGSWNTPKGTYAYDVTSLVTGSDDYNVVVENIATDNTTLLGEMLLVVYEDPNEDPSNKIQLWMLEGNDYLMASHGLYQYCVSVEEATATVAFPGNVGNVESAELIAVVAQGMENSSNMLFNGNVIKTDAWNSSTEAYPDSKINIESVDVTANLSASGNNMGFQDNGTMGMQASNAVLVVEYRTTPPSRAVEVTAEPSTVAPGNVSTIIAEVTEEGNPVANINVDFETDFGNFTESGSTTCTNTTNASGIAIAHFVAAENGTANITATEPTGAYNTTIVTVSEKVCPRYDINEDGTVNYLDLGILGAHYGETTTQPYPRYDMNEDGIVNYLDLGILGAHYGETGLC